MKSETARRKKGFQISVVLDVYYYYPKHGMTVVPYTSFVSVTTSIDGVLNTADMETRTRGATFNLCNLIHFPK